MESKKKNSGFTFGSSQVSNRDLHWAEWWNKMIWKNQHLQVLVSTHLKKCKIMVSGAGFKEGFWWKIAVEGMNDESCGSHLPFLCWNGGLSLKLTAPTWKWMGRNTSFLLGWPIFRCEMLVLGSAFPRECQRDFHIIGNQPTSFTWHTPTKFAVCLPVETITKKNTSGWNLVFKVMFNTDPSPTNTTRLFSCQVQGFQLENYQPWCDEIISCHPLMLQQKSTKFGLQNAENHLLRLDSSSRWQTSNVATATVGRHSINMAICEVAGAVVAVACAATLLEGACGTAVFQPHGAPRPWRIFASKTEVQFVDTMSLTLLTSSSLYIGIHFRQTCRSLNIGFWRSHDFDIAVWAVKGVIVIVMFQAPTVTANSRGP